MTYSVYQHWDPLKVCVVGRSYPPEFYKFIENPRLRELFEKVAIETEEDFQGIVSKLEEFNVKVIRPNVPDVVPEDYIANNKRIPGPVSMIPRDQMIMLGDKFLVFPIKNIAIKTSGLRFPYMRNSGVYPDTDTVNQIVNNASQFDWWTPIIDEVTSAGNEVVDISQYPDLETVLVNGITRIGKDLYFGQGEYQGVNSAETLLVKNQYLNKYRHHIVSTGGHIDGVFTPLKPGCIISSADIKTYKNTFPNWEVAYIPRPEHNAEFKALKAKNKGKWWMPGHEDDDELINFVETHLGDWLGYVEESEFTVNILVINQKNVIVSGYNKEAFDAFEKWGITPHICPLRHSNFWDGGIHCVTLDLSREGDIMNDYFPDRGPAKVDSPLVLDKYYTKQSEVDMDNSDKMPLQYVMGKDGIGFGDITFNGVVRATSIATDFIETNYYNTTGLEVYTKTDNGLDLCFHKGTKLTPLALEPGNNIGQLTIKSYNGKNYDSVSVAINGSLDPTATVGDYLPRSLLRLFVGAGGNESVIATLNYSGVFNAPVLKSDVYTTTTLPSAVTAGMGARAFVTDATDTAFATLYTGGGDKKVPVYSDGTAWYIG